MVVAWSVKQADDEIRSSDINQFSSFLSGTLDQQALLTAYAGTGVALKVRAHSASAMPFQVRNAADTASWLEVHNTTGLLLGGLQSGSFGAPSPSYASSPALGWYVAGTNVLGLASGDANQTLLLGAGAASSGTVQVLQRNAAPKSGVLVHHGSYGADAGTTTAVRPAPDAAPFYAFSTIDGIQGGEWSSVNTSMVGVKGNGGVLFGHKIQVAGSRQFGARASGAEAYLAAGITGIQLTVADDPGMTNQTATDGARNEPLPHVVSGMLMSVKGRTVGDIIQGIELVLSTNPNENTPPTQRVGIIISTADRIGDAEMRAQRGTSLDTHLLLGRKALGPTDQSFVVPWRHGIHLGYAGDPASWPYMADSSFLQADPLLGVDGTYNALGYVAHLGNTRVHQAYIRGGTGSSTFLFDFSRTSAVTTAIMQVGSVPTFMIGSTGFIGVGVAPSYPLDVVEQGLSWMFRLRGDISIHANLPTVPATVARWLNVRYWNGSTYANGQIPIYPG